MATQAELTQIDQRLHMLEATVDDFLHDVHDWDATPITDRWDWSWEWPEAASRIEALGAARDKMTTSQAAAYDRLIQRIRKNADAILGVGLRLPLTAQ